MAEVNEAVSAVVAAYTNELFNYTELYNPQYVERLRLLTDELDWATEVPDYPANRPDFAALSTFEAHERGLAESPDFSKIDRVFEGLTDETGRPLFPLGRTGIAGLGTLWHWGESTSVDVVATRDKKQGPELLIIGKLEKSNKPALPGGFIKNCEALHEAAARETGEETAVRVLAEALQPLGALVTRSKRTTDNAWITTNGFYVHLQKDAALQTPEGGDDADNAAWVPLESSLLDRMSVHHSALVQAAVALGEVSLRS